MSHPMMRGCQQDGKLLPATKLIELLKANLAVKGYVNKHWDITNKCKRIYLQH